MTGLPRAVSSAISKAHAALRRNPELATGIGRTLFPPYEADLIAELVRRDLPYYDTDLSEDFVAAMNGFARDVNILDGDVPYDKVVAL
ncbi:MAG TPA: hypothetical protein VMB48_05625 [Steroidobacteraceae bacterium]|nr:hypothetical protein [Steroidobacteraceae bacterium]